MSSFRGSSQSGYGTQVSRIAARFFSGLSHQETLKYFSTLTRRLWEPNLEGCKYPLGPTPCGWSSLGSFRAGSAPLGSAPRNPRRRRVLRQTPHTPRRRVGILRPYPHALDAGLSTSRPSHAQRQAGVLRSVPRRCFSLVPRAEESFTSVHDAGEFTANSEASSW